MNKGLKCDQTIKVMCSTCHICKIYVQVAALRDELSDKQDLISELRDLNQKFTLAHQRMQADYERLKQEEVNKSVKLQEMILLHERREQVCYDFV